MGYSKRFINKYGDLDKKIANAGGYENKYQIYKDIIFSETFETDDFLELLDKLVLLSTQKDENIPEVTKDLTSPLFSLIFDGDDLVYYEWDDKTYDKYKDYYLKCNNVFSLNEITDSMANNYGYLFDWETIMINTFFIEETVFLHNDTFHMCEAYYDLIFSLEKLSKSFIPASADFFFLLIKMGANFDITEVKTSIMLETTTIGKYIVDNDLIRSLMKLDYPMLYTHRIKKGDDFADFEVSLATLVTRIIMDTELFLHLGLDRDEEDSMDVDGSIMNREIEVEIDKINEDDEDLGF